MKLFIEIHALQNYAPSNLNRDDTGAPKDAIFGGTRRARISSQCLKRAMRQYFNDKKAEGFFKPEELAVRTKRIYQEVANLLVNKKRDHAEALAKVETALAYVNLKASESGEKTQYLLFLGQKEITLLANTINEYWDQIVSNAENDDEKGKAKSKKKDNGNGSSKEVQEKILSVFNGGKAVDLALFGRMLADMPEKNQYAACQVAHAISTHAVDREFDFYTAVDDCKPEDNAGADMMGTIEFNSACFYRYAVVDLEKLQDNLQDDKELAAKGLRAFLEGFVVGEPTGKQNTFAAHNAPEFVVVSVRRNSAPRNLANAFETPIRVRKDESVTQKSAEALVKKAQTLQTAFGGEEKTFVMNLTEAEVNGFGKTVASLQELLDKSMAAARE